MKILALTHPGTTSRGLLLDITAGFQALGHEVLRYELEPVWTMREVLGNRFADVVSQVGRTVRSLIEDHDVHLSLAMWGNGTHTLPICMEPDGSLHAYLDQCGHPHLHYWWDAPHWLNAGQELVHLQSSLYRGSHQLHYINNEGTGAELAAVFGFQNVIPAPNGVNPETFRPIDGIRREYDLAFISGPGDPPPTATMLEEVERDEPDVERIRRDVAASLSPELDRLAGQCGALQAEMRRLFDALVELRLASRHVPALFHLRAAAQSDEKLASAAAALLKRIPLYIKATDTIRRIEKWERPFLVAFLSRHFRCLRLGDQSYDAWGVEGDATGFVPYDRQPEAYARARAALNVMRWQDDIGLNSKIFEITACGVPCLQAYRSGVEKLFDDGELILFRTPGEARDRLAQLLQRPDELLDIGSAGRQRTLRDHTWARRMEPVVEIVTDHWSRRGRPVEASAPAALRTSSSSLQLAFIISPMRSGSTLLRKLLNGHSAIASPPETWFLLPLLNLWKGEGGTSPFNFRQAAVALQSVCQPATFIEATRRFAMAVYEGLRDDSTRWVIDKTPMYMRILEDLPVIFPEARYLILVRDPRDTVWSYHTWEKIESIGLDVACRSVAKRFSEQYEFARREDLRTLTVSYERLCSEPGSELQRVCAFLGLTFEERMLDYGRHQDHRRGYGDEKSEQHRRPHTGSIGRWRQEPDAFPLHLQRQLAEACGEPALRDFGYHDLATCLSAAAV